MVRAGCRTVRPGEFLACPLRRASTPQASPEYCAKPTTRFRRVDRQGILIPIGEEKKCIRFNQITLVIESPFHFAIADRFDRDWLSEFSDMAIGTGARYYQILGPGAIGLTFPDVGCLFQRTPAKLAIGEKRVPDFLVTLYPTLGNVKVALAGESLNSTWRARHEI